MIDSDKYVVLDVETNGLSSHKDDLLSISIYKPDDQIFYNRFLPLELNNRVYTTEINGIKKSDLKGKKPLTQNEFDEICDKFELTERTILTYGEIDERFIKNYLKRKSISGYENLKFYNFKHDIISSKFSEGNITKDNLCNLYGIDGVQEIHSGINDCVLEWKLFEKLNGNKLLITNSYVFELNKNYTIPASYLDSYNNFKYFLSEMRKFKCIQTEIFRKRILTGDIKKFDNNISGIAIEHLINTMLNAKHCFNDEFLINNKRKIKYLGRLPSIYHDIEVGYCFDGTLYAIEDENGKFIDRVNKSTKLLKERIHDLVEFIKENIFKGQQILSQELVVNKKDNVLAKCDLSSNDSVLEIKSYCVNVNEHKNQLFYQSNGRKCYLLQIDWGLNYEDITFIIYRIEFDENVIDKNSLEYRTIQFRNKIVDKTIELIEYINLDSHVILQCKICGHKWSSTCLMAQKENICPVCHPKTPAVKPKLKSLSKEESRQKILVNYFNRVAHLSNGLIECLNYSGSRENASFKCKKCGYEWKTRADHITRNFKCAKCKSLHIN